MGFLSTYKYDMNDNINWRSINYNNVKTVFTNMNKSIHDRNVIMSRTNENKETKALSLSVEDRGTEINFYYIFGNSHVTMIIDDSTIKVLPIVPDSLSYEIKKNIKLIIGKECV